MRRKLLFFSALLAAQTAFAIPALPVWQQHRQADGTVITYKLVGDEHFNFAVTRDNIPLVLKGATSTMPRSAMGVLSLPRVSPMMRPSGSKERLRL